jgi:hypothetical protein
MSQMTSDTTSATTRGRAHLRVLTSSELAAEGFSPAQITKLEGLRDLRPIAEFLDSSAERERLQFLRWMHRSGRLSEGTPEPFDLPPAA